MEVRIIHSYVEMKGFYRLISNSNLEKILTVELKVPSNQLEEQSAVTRFSSVQNCPGGGAVQQIFSKA
jgi:hypothetical protein